MSLFSIISLPLSLPLPTDTLQGRKNTTSGQSFMVLDWIQHIGLKKKCLGYFMFYKFT